MNKQMNELEATRAKLKCLEMVEGTKLKWWEVVKYVGDANNKKWKWGLLPNFSAPDDDYIFALGIVEGKPVWEGDELYFDGAKCTASSEAISSLNEWNAAGLVSWNPPKPKTVMVELPIATVEFLANRDSYTPELLDAFEACRKTLEEIK